MLDPKLDSALELLQRTDGLLAAVCYSLSLEVRESPGMWTTATTGDKILVDPKFLAATDTRTLAARLAHEAAHLVFDHPARKKHREHVKWNVACDRVINRCLDAKKEWQNLPIPWGTPPDPTQRDEEELYEHEPEQPQGECAMLTPEDATAAEAVQGRIRGIIEGAIQAGTAPSWIKERYKPKDSRLKLEPLLTTVVRGREEYSWRRPARATQQCGIYLPSLRTQRASGSIMVSIDTSGSMCADDISKATGIVQRVSQSKSRRLIVVIHDTQAEVVYDGPANGWVNRDIRAGGGTDFRPLMALAAKMKPEVLVAITDLEGPHGPRPGRMKVLWVVPEHAGQPPFGTRCKL